MNETRREAQIDSDIARAMRAVETKRAALAGIYDEVRIMKRVPYEFVRGVGRVYSETLETTLGSLDKEIHWRLWNRIDDMRSSLAAAKEALKEQQARYEGWSRFYLVVSSDGHIHSSTGCPTCYSTTSYAWLTELSGLTEVDAVASQGEILCSACHPSAPVAWTIGKSKASIEARTKRAERSAELAAKREAKILAHPDGEPVGKLDMEYSEARTFTEGRDGLRSWAYQRRHGWRGVALDNVGRRCEALSANVSSKRSAEAWLVWALKSEGMHRLDIDAVVTQVWPAS